MAGKRKNRKRKVSQMPKRGMGSLHELNTGEGLSGKSIEVVGTIQDSVCLGTCDKSLFTNICNIPAMYPVL